MAYNSKEKEKEYQKAYHARTWENRKLHHQDQRKKRRTNFASWLKEYKTLLQCVKSSESHPAYLDFHHKDPQEKYETVANMISRGSSLKEIQEEIDKCIVCVKIVMPKNIIL